MLSVCLITIASPSITCEELRFTDTVLSTTSRLQRRIFSTFSDTVPTLPSSDKSPELTFSRSRCRSITLVFFLKPHFACRVANCRLLLQHQLMKPRACFSIGLLKEVGGLCCINWKIQLTKMSLTLDKNYNLSEAPFEPQQR